MDIQIYDTTLRDGTQREGISLSCDDKLRIAARLDELGVAFIEGGWPGSNPKDAEFFARAPGLRLRHAVITSFGSTCRVGGKAAEDQNIAALIDAGTSVCALVGKTSLFHVREVLRTTPEENLRIIRESTAYLAGKGRRVFYDAEHFFDGYRLDREYALATLRAAAEGGAEVLVLCDTNGGTMPWDVAAIVADVRGAQASPVGIHTHNDAECGVANSLAAVRKGAIQVQGTINGYGERCGNANLVSVIADLTLKMGCRCIPEGNLSRLTDTAHYVAEIANLSPDNHLPYVGKSAFAHKGGIHVAAIRRTPDSYQHCDPALVGNAMRVVVSELSGRANLASKSEEFGLGEVDASLMSSVLGQIKALEARGFSFEAAEASVALMMRRGQDGYAPPFRLIDLTVNVEHRDGRGIFAEATVKLDVGGDVIHTVAEGNGPVNALDTAVRKALTPVYPKLGSFRLADYKVRILDGTNGTGATTRVLIETRNGTRRWSTVGASTNIIEASWRALADSIEFGLTSGDGAGA
ncbi:MAG TPA: citramalate synthase [Bacteroidota bacterium]|nr:citramalate synthase [Bacteroidota bacterium]